MKEKILELLESEFDALDVMVINDKLGLTTVEELRELQYALNELIDELVVYQTKKNKYILYTKCPNFRKGVIDISKKGFGFLLLDDENDIYISKDNLAYALDGDTVLVEITDFNPEKPEGKVIKVLKRDLKNIVGTIKSNGSEIYFEPNEPLKITLSVDADSLKQCVEGEIVVVSIIDDLGKNKYIGQVSQHICHKDDPKQDILSIAAKYEIYEEFPEDAIIQAEEMPTEVLESEKVGRIDLTDEIIFTIDGEDTKDIDDAIGLELKDGYYILKVCIADVAHYVTENSPLDVEALRRGTSSYLAYSVIPQLPHKLSNGICSLNPNVERLTLTCEMKIDSRGHVVDSSIYESFIESKKKMTYTSVNHLIMDNVIDPGYEEFATTLKHMQDLAHIIREERTRRGASDFDLDEPKIICDENGVAIDIKKRDRGEGERLIEDFMVIANETVAKTLACMNLPAIYRVHDIPKPEKVQQFISFCNATGRPIKGKFNKMNPRIYQKLLSQVEVGDDGDRIYRSLAVRTMPKANYTKDNIGHFGLASMYYTHFTSPIRRYPDLQTHRLLKDYIIKGKLDERTINYWNNNLEAIARQSSEREILAVEAEREVDKMKMAEYMEQHVGEEFEGIVSGVIGFGMFIQLDNLVEGLVPITSLSGDYFEYMEDLQCLMGKSTKIRYTIGDRVKVRCVRASKVESQIDFELVKELKLDNDPEKKRVLKK